ncbi:MAG: polymer-forming cytoskeletal protein [Treponema sp.]|jgi:cytoskeletal protein CcmA (bactofilin family)|nr:polymer-forming cytoskeletal protein [Treponema sp.]
MSANKREDFSVNTIIGPNTHINGDVNSAGFTRVDGSLRGNLTAAGRIIVGDGARMKGNITGTAVTIGGVVCGNVLASERVIILATGIVLGDIITQRIQADEGGLLHGRIMVCQTREKWNNTVNEYRDREDVKSVTAGFTPRPNSAVSNVPAAELLPENGIQAAGTASPETVFPALEPETINPAPAAVEDQTPAFKYAALTQETPSAGEQTAGESPPENAAPENAPVLPAESPSENAPVTADGTAFPENTAVSAEELPPENVPLTADGAAFPENAPGRMEEAVPPENTAVSAEDTLTEKTMLPVVPFSGTAGTDENHGEG